MKPFTVVVVLIASTGLGIAFRNGLSGLTNAAPMVTTAEAENASPQVSERPAIKETTPPVQPTLVKYAAGIGQNKVNDLVLARIAAECGDHLYQQAKQNPRNVQVLRQSLQHYRASLSHEVTASQPGTFFQDVRARIDQIEDLLKRAETPSPVLSKVEEADTPLTPVETPKPGVQEKTSEGVMVGPDGIPIKRVPRDE